MPKKLSKSQRAAVAEKLAYERVVSNEAYGSEPLRAYFMRVEAYRVRLLLRLRATAT